MCARKALVAVAATLLVCAGAAAQDDARDARTPGVGYVCPAGGRQGTVFEVVVGGQFLGGVRAAHVTGQGVHARVLRHMRPLNNQQEQTLRRAIASIRKERRDAAAAQRAGGRRAPGGDAPAAGEPEPEDPRGKLPSHPLLDRLDTLDDAELDRVAARFLVRGGRKQINAQLAETVEIEVEVAPGVEAGVRELRLETRGGLSNPLRFVVGSLPETSERESFRAEEPDLVLTQVPVVVNGQILPGDVDRFHLTALRGQRLRVTAAARSLVPFLADAVPGWFQATLTVLDATGRELVFCDDSGHEPDPGLVFQAPADGDYVIEIRDALYRGREDFVYRLRVEDPGAADEPMERPRTAGSAREVPEVELNDSPGDAQGLILPAVVRGLVARPGDLDHFVFSGRAGDEVVMEVEARRSHSPVDALLRLLDGSGEVVAWNDDHPDPAPGLLTHDADPYLRVRLPHDGAFVVQVSDAQHAGGPRHVYRLRVGPPQPDFLVAVTPSSLSVPAGRTVALGVHVVRRDGFAGGIDLRIEGPQGFLLGGGHVPEGRDSIRVTLTAPSRWIEEPTALTLTAHAVVGRRQVSHPVSPADERTQAFVLRHLVPAQALVVVVPGGAREVEAARITSELPVVLTPGGRARVDLEIPGLPADVVLRLRLDDPPPGIALDGWESADGRLRVLLRAEEAPSGGWTQDNLLVRVEVVGRQTVRPGRRVAAGHLPAIPVRRVAADGSH